MNRMHAYIFCWILISFVGRDLEMAKLVIHIKYHKIHAKKEAALTSITFLQR